MTSDKEKEDNREFACLLISIKYSFRRRLKGLAGQREREGLKTSNITETTQQREERWLQMKEEKEVAQVCVHTHKHTHQ